MVKIKKVVFRDLKTTLTSAIGGIRFLDKNDTLIDSGSIITNTNKTGETTNFSVVSSVAVGYEYGNPVYAIDTSKPQIASSYSRNYWQPTSNNASLEIIFKVSKELLSISYNRFPETATRGVNGEFYIDFYDDNGKLVHSLYQAPKTAQVNLIVTEPLKIVQDKILIKKSDGVYVYFDVNDGTFKPLGHEPTDSDFLNLGLDKVTKAHIQQLGLQGIKGRKRIRRL